MGKKDRFIEQLKEELEFSEFRRKQAMQNVELMTFCVIFMFIMFVILTVISSMEATCG